MESKDYQKYTISTIESYPQKFRKHLKSLFVDKGIAQAGDQLEIGKPTAINIDGYNLNEQLSKCICENPDSAGVFEAWEFEKDYKYSVLFESDSFEELINTINSNSLSFENKEYPLFNKLCEPVYKVINASISLLKFNLKFEAVHPQTAEELFIRYPVVVAFHKEHQIIEVRFDALKHIFMENSDSFYAKLIDDVCAFIEKEYGHHLTTLQLDFLIKSVQQDDSDVKLVAQSMKMANGSYAQLDVGNNEEYVLPFIGELKNFLAEYSAEFEQVPVLKEAFEQFVFEKDVTSDYPWIELLWDNEIKTRSIHVKLTFNYYQKGYCLLQHYFNNALIGMERMNNVVGFISSARGNP